MDEVTEGDVLETLRGEAGMLDTALSVLEFKNAIKVVVRMKPVLSAVERIHEVKMDVVDLAKKNGWRPAVRIRFNWMPLYGRLVVEAFVERIWSNEFRERVVTETRFLEISSDPDFL